MTKSEAQDVLKRMANLYDRQWEPTKEKLDAWVRLLLPFEYDIAWQAIEKCWQDGPWPQPHKVRRICQDLTRKEQPPRPEDGGGRSNAWIQCVHPPEKFPGRRGWAVELVYGSDSRIPPDHVVMQDAQRMLQEHETRYGGTWRILQNHTTVQMFESKSILEAELDRMLNPPTERQV